MTPFSPPPEAIGKIGANSTSRRSTPLKADALRARAKEALVEEFGDVGFAVVKDPRMCRLMPFWGPVFSEAKWSVRALLPIRPPLEVSSIAQLPRRHQSRIRVSALAAPRPRRRGSKPVTWPALFWTGRNFSANGRKALAQASEQLGVIWPYWCESALADIDQFVSTDLRRQRTSEADLQSASGRQRFGPADLRGDDRTCARLGKQRRAEETRRAARGFRDSLDAF